jgi:hypothetical protein
MKNLKTTMIAALLMLAAVGEVVAQEKYDYAIIFADPNGKPIIHKVTNTGHEQLKTSSKGSDLYGQLQDLLNVVHNETANGWEVINIIPLNISSTERFYLKKIIK